jgi:hypothetical protein
MTARTLAAVGLRFIGACLVLRALFGLVCHFFLVHRAAMLGQHTRWFDGGLVQTAVDANLHDTYYVISHFTLTGASARLLIGLVLLLATKPIARLITWKLDNF